MIRGDREHRTGSGAGLATRLRLLVALAGLGLLAACSSGPSGPTTPSADAIGTFKVGKPYQIAGVWYYPKIDWEYRETGIASWYGPGFHGKRTANGEIYNQNDLTAAHPTLPMPVMVRVTNLENGRSIKVRINDRGPFANGRIIDLSKRSAQLLDIERAGTAKVLVEILADESQQLVAIAQGHTAVTDDSDVPEAAPVESLQATPLGGSGGAPATTVQPTPPASPSLPPATSVTAATPVPWPEERVEQKNVQPTEIYIQAGSFANPSNAEGLRSQLAAFGRAFVAVARVGTQDFYRVRVGPIGNVEEADRVLAQMIAAGHTESRVVVD